MCIRAHPTTVTAFMAVGVKAAAFAAFARFFLHTFGVVHADWQGILWVVAALTMTVGNITALVQHNIKRMLAYSSIAHAGYPPRRHGCRQGTGRRGSECIIWWPMG